MMDLVEIINLDQDSESDFNKLAITVNYDFSHYRLC